MSEHDEAGAPPFSSDMPEWAIGIRVPRVSARALIMDGDDIIAVEKLVAPGKLHMPGGGVDHGETMLAALRRELDEELGIVPASADYLLAIENLFDTYLGLYHSVEHVFLITPDSTPTVQEEGLQMHRLPLARIGDAPFYPLVFRDLLTQPDWRARRYLLAGKFAGDD